MSHLDVIKDQVRAYCQGICGGSTSLTGFQDDETFRVFDDENPEGGVLVNVTYLTTSSNLKRYEGWAVTPTLEDRVRQACKVLEQRLQPYTTSSERTFKLVPEPDGAIVAAFYFLPTLHLDEYQDYALRIWKANPEFEDRVLRVRYDGHFLETTRVSNNNPTTYIKFDGKDTLGECIRHHGEHVYLNKHLLKLIARLSEAA